jgi:hypothetical protein
MLYSKPVSMARVQFSFYPELPTSADPNRAKQQMYSLTSTSNLLPLQPLFNFRKKFWLGSRQDSTCSS